jgi:hypothetical protein
VTITIRCHLNRGVTETGLHHLEREFEPAINTAVDTPRRVEVTKAVQATAFRAGQQMTTDETNVVPFAPRRPEPPALTHVEVRLNEQDCSLVLTVYDEAGNRFAIDYALGWSPPDFDLNRLHAAWPRWRGTATAAS